MTIRLLSTRRSPAECRARLADLVDGRLPIPGLSVARAEERSRLLGRITDDGFSGVLVDTGPGWVDKAPAVLRALFGYQMATTGVRVRVFDGVRGGRGTGVRVSFHQPFGDALLLAMLLAISLSVLRGSVLELVAAFPISLGIYLFLPIVRRAAVARAEDEVMSRVSEALDAKPIQA